MKFSHRLQPLALWACRRVAENPTRRKTSPAPRSMRIPRLNSFPARRWRACAALHQGAAGGALQAKHW